MPSVFISYRRKESQDYCHFVDQLYRRLSEEFSPTNLFLDKHRIKPGNVFDITIREALSDCEVMIVVIGKNWLLDKEGNRRIDREDDYVRLEVRTGLRRGIKMIPVLIDSTPIPSEKELPNDLKLLLKYQFLTTESKNSFEEDIDRLVKEVVRTVPFEERVNEARWNGAIDYYQACLLMQMGESDREEVFDYFIRQAPTIDTIQAQENRREVERINKHRELLRSLISHRRAIFKVGCVLVMRKELDVKLRIVCPISLSRVSTWSLLLTKGWSAKSRKYLKRYPPMDEKHDPNCEEHLIDIVSEIISVNEYLGVNPKDIKCRVKTI